MIIFDFLNDQLLRMNWLNQLIHIVIEDVFRLSTTNRIGASLHFFIFDVIKIFILLSALIFILSYIQSYFPPERTKQILSKYNGFTSRMLGALLGTLTPFCSCSSIPLFIGFTGAGIPIGVTFAFLISSPLVDLASFILLASVFNWTIATIYIAVGLVLAVFGGSVIQMMKVEKYVAPFVFQNHMAQLDPAKISRKERLIYSKTQVVEIASKVWLYIIIGVGLGAAIHNWIPAAFIQTALGSEKWYAVPIATILGAPMYADLFGTLPIAEALVNKGVGLGTILAFMMAVTALSLPSLIMLKKVIQTKLLVIFAGIVLVGILIIGYTFNWLSPYFI